MMNNKLIITPILYANDLQENQPNYVTEQYNQFTGLSLLEFNPKLIENGDKICEKINIYS